MVVVFQVVVKVGEDFKTDVRELENRLSDSVQYIAGVRRVDVAEIGGVVHGKEAADRSQEAGRTA